jgi:hypothetical protein
MFWKWMVTHIARGCAPLEDAPDATGASGGADPSDPGDGSQPSGDEIAGDEGGAGGGADVDDDSDVPLDRLLVDDDVDDQTRPIEQRLKALDKKNRKLKRQLAKRAGTLQRLEGIDLDDLVASKRKLAEFNELLSKNPRIRALLNGDAEPEPERRTPAADPEEQFDEANLPFDVNENDTHRFFAKMARQNFEMQKELKKLRGDLSALDGRDRTRTESQVRDTWRSTIVAAADKIKSTAVRKLFMDNLAAHYNDPRVRAKFTPQQLVNHYLSELKADGLITEAQAKATSAAAAPATPKTPVRTAATQQRIAEANKSLPRTAAVTGTPAPARSQRPSMQELGKKLRRLSLPA